MTEYREAAAPSADQDVDVSKPHVALPVAEGRLPSYYRRWLEKADREAAEKGLLQRPSERVHALGDNVEFVFVPSEPEGCGTVLFSVFMLMIGAGIALSSVAWFLWIDGESLPVRIGVGLLLAVIALVFVYVALSGMWSTLRWFLRPKLRALRATAKSRAYGFFFFDEVLLWRKLPSYVAGSAEPVGCLLWPRGSLRKIDVESYQTSYKGQSTGTRTRPLMTFTDAAGKEAEHRPGFDVRHPAFDAIEAWIKRPA